MKVLDYQLLRIQHLHTEMLRDTHQLEQSRRIQMMAPSKYAELIGVTVTRKSMMSPKEISDAVSDRNISKILRKVFK